MSIYEDFTKISMKNVGKLRRACSLLNESFGVTYLSYFAMGTNGYGSLLSSNLEFVDHYLENRLYFSDRLLVHPIHLREGAILWSSLGKAYEKVHDPNRFNMDHGITLFRKSENPDFSYEAFGFATFQGNAQSLNLYLNEMDTLKLFCNFLKKEMASVFKELHSHPIDIATLKGSSFHEPLPGQNSFISEQKPRINLLFEKFGTKSSPVMGLKVPLSKQEDKCLILFLKGYTARETAEVLNLSSRTVEHYMDSVKNKLNCEKKSDLLRIFGSLKS